MAKKFRVLEEDGHNAPLWWSFRDIDHACQVLAKRLDFWNEGSAIPGYGPRSPEQIKKMLEWDELQDANGTRWTMYGERDIAEIDVTEED